MYTSFIGRKFLAAWNAKEGKSLTARQFFDEEMFPIFFDDERHLMHVANSPFFQSIAAKDLIGGKKESEIRRENLHHSIATKNPNASIFVGYAADGTTGTTSGQVTALAVDIDHEEIYASWIGEGLAMGVSGGFYLLCAREALLLEIFAGWELYRKFLKQTPNLKGRQIETWNGQWIAHCLSGGSIRDFTPKYDEKIDAKTKAKYWAINTLEWTKLIFAFCKRYPNEMLTVYAYNLSQMNTTLGFLNLKLPEVHLLYEVRDKLFIDKGKSALTDNEIESLESVFTFKRAAEFGAIGLRTLEPAKLREYLPQRDSKKNKDLNLTKEEAYKQFQIFKIWIYAMLNRTELLDLAAQVAQHLLNLEEQGRDRGKKITDQLSTEVREATSLRAFVEKLGEVLNTYSAASETFRKVVDNVVKMPSDQFPLFVALIRFEYSYLKARAKSN